MNKLSKTDLNKEFKRQIECLLQLSFPLSLGVSEAVFIEHILLLKEKLSDFTLGAINMEQGYLPFVIVVKQPLKTAEQAMSLITKNNKPGTSNLKPLEAKDFKIIEGVNIPEGIAYLLVDIDRGKEYLNIKPSAAIDIIKKEGRTPLTIDEGIAIVTLYPEFLIKNNCFSLLGSRTGNDKRVPAIWINSNKEANLGWCWDGNPHTWLGSASTLTRIGI